MSEDKPTNSPRADPSNASTQDNDTRINIESEDVSINIEESSEYQNIDPLTTNNGIVPDLIVEALEKQTPYHAQCPENLNAAHNLYGMNLNGRSVAVYFDQMRPAVDPNVIRLQYSPNRNSFVRMVFAITGLMLLATTAFTFFTFTSEEMQKLFRSMAGFMLFLCAFVVDIAMSYVMYCSTCSRKPPCNYLCLFIAVAAMSIIVAFITIRYNTKIVLISFVGTGIICLICLGLAYTNFDFTKYILIVGVASLAVCIGLFGSGILRFFGVNIKLLHIGLLIILLVLQSVMLVIELQMILGGKTVELGEDDYALGAYMLYMSIIEIFLNLLRLLNELDLDF